MKYSKFLIFNVVFPFLYYPVYFISVNLIDIVCGGYQLDHAIRLNSYSRLIKIFLVDWLDSLPVMVALFVFVNVLFAYILITNERFRLPVYLATCVATAAVLSMAVGLNFEGALANSLGMLVISTMYYFFSRFTVMHHTTTV